VIDCGIDHGVIEKRGTWLSFDGTQLGQGREAAAEQLSKEPELEKKLIAQIKEKMKLV
jgi:recombination protein RecA